MHALTVGYWTTILDSTREMNVIRCREYLLKGNISPKKWRMIKSQPGKDRDFIQLCKEREILAEGTAARLGEEELVLGGRWPTLMVAPGSQSHMSLTPSPPSYIYFTPYWVFLQFWVFPLVGPIDGTDASLTWKLRRWEATARQKPQQQQQFRKHAVESVAKSGRFCPWQAQFHGKMGLKCMRHFSHSLKSLLDYFLS